MSINTSDLIARLESHALALGIFQSVNGHEPKNAPGAGLNAALWVQSIEPIRSSGLDSTSVRIEFSLRIYQNMLKDPQDSIDPALIDAVDVLFGQYSGDFDLAQTVRQIDLLGTYGNALSAQAGYISQDSKLYRVMTITLPVIVNDTWEQDSNG